MDYRTSRALDRLHQRDPDMAHIFTELLLRTAEPSASAPTRTDVMKLLQPPYIWVILTLGALALQVPLPQAIEILKLGIGAQ